VEDVASDQAEAPLQVARPQRQTAHGRRESRTTGNGRTGAAAAGASLIVMTVGA